MKRRQQSFNQTLTNLDLTLLLDHVIRPHPPDCFAIACIGYSLCEHSGIIIFTTLI